MNYHLAQINIGRMVAPIDSPAMADFVANLNRINALAEGSRGFVWRLKDETNNATSVKVFADDRIIVNMSVWTDIDSLFQFTYKSDHTEIFKRRREWFEKMDVPMVLWYIPVGHIPTVAEAIERLTYLRENGDSPYAFGFRERFTPTDAAAYKHGR